MPAVRRTTAHSTNHVNTAVTEKARSHANDPYVVKKVEQAKAFIQKAGVPKPKK